jgi:aldose sugar dehydrogenase
LNTSGSVPFLERMPRPNVLQLARLAPLFSTFLVLAAEPRDPAKLAVEFCVSCHNQNLVGSPAPNLVDLLWTHGGSDEAILRNIRQGFPQSGMPGFEGVLSEPEMLGLIRHMRALSREYVAGRIKHPVPPAVLPLKTELHGARLETWIDGLETPWGLEFLPDGRLLVTEREGRLRIVRDGRLDPEPVRGLPAIFVKQDGGLLDVIAHPRFAENGWIYLAYVDTGRDPATSMTVVIRGRIREGAWVDQREIFRGPPESYVPGWTHYGARFLFDRDGRLLFTLGDRGVADAAQDPASPLGKIHRVLDDGGVPTDNPFAGRAGAWSTVWTLGNRHAQGLKFHPVTGDLWESEHGPSGGDEINVIVAGANYGWPLTSRGTDRRRGFAADAPGTRQPLVAWTPSVAPSGIEFYTGDKFPRWRNHLFVACLGGEQLKRLETDGQRVIREEIVFKGYGRVRDVITGPDGFLYLAINSPGRIARLVPDFPVATR